MTHLRTFAVYAYLAAGGATLGGLALASALAGDREGRIWWPLSRWGSRAMLGVCGVTDLRLEGPERLIATRPAVVVANHESLFDPAVLMKASDLPLRFIVKREVERFPIFGRALSAMGHVFIDRGEGTRAQEALDVAAAALLGGSTVMAFPEGTRADGDELRPFRRGAFELAIRAKVPIVPAGIAGTGRILPKRGGWQRRGPVALSIGVPIQTSNWIPSEAELLAARARDEVSRLRERARRLCDSPSSRD
jgi:1-acyl-sn-glycerol-3-phosphate acyltransferase